MESVVFTSGRLLFYTVLKDALKRDENNVKKSQRILWIVWKNLRRWSNARGVRCTTCASRNWEV